MGKSGLMAAGAVGLMALAGVAVAADQTGSNASAKAAAPTASSTAVQQAHLAGELADYGRSARSPMALVLAAELTAATAGPDVKRTKTAEAGTAAAPAADKTDKPATTVASLLSEARAMAGPDASLQPVIQRIAAMENKGRDRGPSRTYERVLAGGSDSYTTRFVGGEPAIVYVDGDGDTDLDLYVYDQNGNQICSDTDNTDTMLCQWTPAWTGTFTVKIKNYGRVYNNYMMRTN